MPVNILAYWQQFTAWFQAKKRSWLYTKTMKVVGPLGVSYAQLEASYAYSGVFPLIYTILPWLFLISWYLFAVGCTWHPSRPFIPQDLCVVPGFQQLNDSSWPIDRFYQTNGSEQGAARYLKTVMEIEQALQEFSPKFERFSLLLCNALDDIDHGFWTFVRNFDKYTASTDDHPYMSWSSLAFYPWEHVARLVNSELSTTYLPKYRPYSWRTAGEVIYEYNRFFVLSMKALDDIDRGFLAHDLPEFLKKWNPLRETYTLLHTSDSHHIDWERNAALKSCPLHQQLAWRYLGVEPKALDSFHKYRALYDRNGNRLSDIEDALHNWDTYLAQLRQQILSLRHLFQRKTTIVDLLFHKPGSVRALMKELKDLRKEKHIKEAAARFANVMHFSTQIGRLHDMIAGVSSGPEECSCLAEMHRARQAYQKEIGNDEATVIKKLFKAHRDFKKGKPLPDHW